MAEHFDAANGALVFDSAFLAQLEMLRLNLRQNASGNAMGGRKSKQKGNSVEFSDFRDYQLGDDFRRIDWNAYARFDRLILKLFMEEKQMRMHLLVDVSASMDAPGGTGSKLVLAKRLCAVMAYLTLSGYDMVDISLLCDGVCATLPAFSGKQGFLKVLNFLENTEIPLQSAKKSLLASALQRVPLGTGGGVCVLFTDGFSDDELDQGLRYLQYKKQRVSVVHILSQEELHPQWGGKLRLVDCESEAYKDVECSEQVMSAYQKTLNRFLDDIHALCHARGMDYVFLPSDIDVRRAVFEKLLPNFGAGGVARG